MKKAHSVQNAECNPPKKHSIRIAVFLGYVFTGVLGLPVYLMGMLFNSQKMLGSWKSMSWSFASDVLNYHLAPPEKIDKQGVKEEVPKVGNRSFWRQVQLDDGILLSIVPFGENMFRRFTLTTVPGSFATKRTNLTYVLGEELVAFGFPVTSDGALEYTLSQIKQGVLAGVAQHRSMTPATAPTSTTDAAKPESVNPHVPRDERPLERNAVSNKPKAEKPQMNQATGRVISIGKRRVTPEGRAPYESFSVVLSTKDGEAVFSGVDLQEKFVKGDFDEGDVVSIAKNTVNYTVEINGKEVKRRKNEFKVERVSA